MMLSFDSEILTSNLLSSTCLWSAPVSAGALADESCVGVF